MKKLLVGLLLGTSILSFSYGEYITSTNNGFSKEFNDAYEFAYKNGITSMSTIEDANMYGNIKRSEFAKMISNREINLGHNPDVSKQCKFNDINSLKGSDLYDAVINACQLGIMGQGITDFRPNDTITRAEVLTTISRVLWGNEYEGCTPYFSCHANAIKTVGIWDDINNIDKITESRGNVMLMLMRAGNINIGDGSIKDLAIEYNDNLVDIFESCYLTEDAVREKYESGSAKEFEAALNNTISKCNAALTEIQNIDAFYGDSSLRDGTALYIKGDIAYYTIMKDLVKYQDYTEADFKKISEKDWIDHETTLDKLDEILKTLDSFSQNLSETQEKFAKKFGYELFD